MKKKFKKINDETLAAKIDLFFSRVLAKTSPSSISSQYISNLSKKINKMSAKHKKTK